MSKFNNSKIHLGMSDEELVKISKNRKILNGSSPWVFWESERTSFGKTFRNWAFYPSFLPLFFSSDHYVDLTTAYRENECKTESNLYFSWNKKKVNLLRENYGVNAIHVKHPWIAWRQRKYPKPNPNARGTVLFWPHTHDSLEVTVEIEKVKLEISKLSQVYHPIVIMVSSHDILKNKHIHLRKLGLPIISAGAINSQRFVDNFYSIISNFRFGAGLHSGSQIYYCLEFGLPYRILANDALTMVSLGQVDRPAGIFNGFDVDYPDPEERAIFDEWFESLKVENLKVTEDQLCFVNEQLGLNSSTGRLKFSLLVWNQLILNFYKIPILWLKLFKPKRER